LLQRRFNTTYRNNSEPPFKAASAALEVAHLTQEHVSPPGSGLT